MFKKMCMIREFQKTRQVCEVYQATFEEVSGYINTTFLLVGHTVYKTSTACGNFLKSPAISTDVTPLRRPFAGFLN
jgi:hypothetical protein